MIDTPTRAPSLERWEPASGATVRGAVLALHGGRPTGRRPVGRFDLPALRMLAIARRVHDRLASDGVAVWPLRYSMQGWNGAEMSPVADARRALRQIADTDDVPVVLLGHSMGGRTALRVAGEENVVGIVALAPWLPPGEPMGDLGGRGLVIAHGGDDRTTDPRASRAYADAARDVAASVRHVDVPGEGHALLRRPSWWNEFAADAVRDLLDLAGSAGPDGDR